jgi:undecaprenyl-diphosphatase
LNLFHVVILGLVQGLTEFLPVSSDGHLAIFRNLMHVPSEHALALDVSLHIGTLAAMLVFFWKDILRLVGSLSPGRTDPPAMEDRRRIMLIAAATVVTGVVGLSLKGPVERFNSFLPAAGLGFLATTAFLLAGILGGNSRVVYSLPEIPLWHALVLGLVQGLAVWPGLSRSGSTIATALFLGWGWKESGRFAFLMAFPALVGAMILTAKDMTALGHPGLILTGIGVSLFTGLGALALLMRFLEARKLLPFAVYTGLLALYAFVK